MEITALGTVRLLEAIRGVGTTPQILSGVTESSEMSGKVQDVPQRETTLFYPRSPYGAAKVYAHWITVNYREAYNFARSGILFNHESPRRGNLDPEDHKALRGLLGLQQDLFLGNLDEARLGYAGDYVEAMWVMLQQEQPDDYVGDRGRTRSASFSRWHSAIWTWTGSDDVKIDPRYFRPTEVDLLIGDPSKARRQLPDGRP